MSISLLSFWRMIKLHKLLSVIWLIFFLFSLLFGVASYFLSDRGQIFWGITVRGLNLGGFTPKESERLLEDILKPQLPRSISLKHNNLKWEASLDELGIELNLKDTVAQAFKVGREGDFFQRLLTRLRTATEGREISPKFQINEIRAKRYLKKIANRINKAPRDADLLIKAGQFEIIPEVWGRKLQIPETLNEIRAALSGGDYEEIALAVVPLKPKVLTEDLKDIDGQIASYSTYYRLRQTNRNYNMKKIADILDGTLLRPGEVFSYNQLVGPRTRNLGYRIAPVMVNGELVPGTGGGACQVSTTLYNLALLANLKILERHHHAAPVRYVPLGRDATVVYGLADLKFKNTLSKPILIKTTMKGGKLTISAWGTKSEGLEVRVFSVVNKVIPSGTKVLHDLSLPKGQKKLTKKGKVGYKVTVIRVVKLNGAKISSEVISRDYYRPRWTVLRLGAKVSSHKMARAFLGSPGQ